MDWFNKDIKANSGGTNIEDSEIFQGNITKSNGSDMLCIEPKTFDDVQAIIDHLKTMQPAILNIGSSVRKDVAQRILDFISGAIYALDGSIFPLENGLFALTPKGSSISTNKF